MTNTLPLPELDLTHVLSATETLWNEAREARIFLTGGTGFFGSWLVETFAHANRILNLNASITVLTRSPESFLRKSPHLADRKEIQLLAGDIRNFQYPAGKYDYLIHGATPASARLNEQSPREMFDIICRGTARALEFAEVCAPKKILLLSSGAVYGRQPPALSHIPEEYEGAPDPTQSYSAYGEGKRAAEFLSCCGSDPAVIARCFAFVGPHLPLDQHFAIGNFIRDALSGSPIVIQGDGRPRRSYLHAADLAIWLWTLLFRGTPGRAYNVGSSRDYSIAEVAQRVKAGAGISAEIRVETPSPVDELPPRYVPSIERAERELGLRECIDLSEAIERTLRWLGKQSG